MREVREEVDDEGQHSDLSPYHSDSDSAVMMSGNSPFISKVGLGFWSSKFAFLQKVLKYDCHIIQWEF